jgi:C4-dicarboxylate-specific signal transduction histidine kinase
MDKTSDRVKIKPLADTALENSEARYRDLLDFVPVALVRLDRTKLALTFDRLRSRGVQYLGRHIDDHPRFLKAAMNSIRVIEANKKAMELFGAAEVRELLGSAALLWTENPEAFRQSMEARFRGGGRFEAEIRIRTFQQEVRNVLYVTDFPEARHNAALGLTCLIDIDDRVKAQEALANVQAEIAHASRLSTLGELTASIAHEINQPLGAIMTNGEAALRWLSQAEPDLSEVRNLSERIIADAQRAADIIERIRATIVRKEPEPVRLSLNELVEDVVMFLGPEFRQQTIDVAVDPYPGLIEIVSDRVQIQQVIVNFAMNAVQAMADISPGSRRLVFRTRATETMAVLEVEDTGPGISAGDIDSVFDAFFTTKSSGTGMGLAICRSIAETYGGRILAGNAVGNGGAVFSVELPLAFPNVSDRPSST